MNLFLRSFAVVLVMLSASGCIYVNGKQIDLDDWQETQRDNREAIAQLAIGMERSTVVSRLGAPNDSEAFSKDGKEIRVLFYRTQRKHSDGETTRDETTPLVFEDDVLIGWGNNVYVDARSGIN